MDQTTHVPELIKGAPAGWPWLFIGQVIRYRWFDDVPWRYGLVKPYAGIEDACSCECIRVADFNEIGEAKRSNALRFASRGEWTPGARVEIVDVPWG